MKAGPGSVLSVVLLRIVLWDRGLRQRGAMTRVGGWLGVVAGFFVLGALVYVAWTMGSEAPPDAVLRMGGLLAATAPLLLLTDALVRAGQGTGMGPSLVHFPISPREIHLAELVATLSSPAILAATTALTVGLLAGGGPVVGVAWSGATFLGFLLSLALLLRLGALSLLQRRLWREVALVASTVLLLSLWVGFISLTDRIGADARLPDHALPTWLWFLPPAWFVTPGAPPGLVPVAARVLGAVGAPLLMAGAFLLGAVLQERICFGESDGFLGGRRRRRRKRARAWTDRAPLSWVPAPVWATAGKEILSMRRDPFLVLMLVSQAVILLVIPLLWRSGLLGGGKPGGGLWGWYMPFFVLLLVVAKQQAVFNQVAMEGRGLEFLAQIPVPRWWLVLGKNLAYVVVFGVFDATFLLVAAWVFDQLDQYPMYLAMAAVAMVLMLGVGNVVSVVLPTPWIGARAAAGGSRAAHSAAEGGVPRPTLGVILGRMVAIQGLYMLLFPALFAVAAISWWLHGGLAVAGTVALVSFCLLVWTLGTGVAVARFKATEGRLRARFAGRGAG